MPIQDATLETWTKDRLEEAATAEFRHSFAALPTHNTLSFKDLEHDAVFLSEVTSQPVKMPAGLLPKLLLVGNCKSNTSNDNKVYAFIYGEKKNQVGYIASADLSGRPNGGAYIRLRIQDSLDIVDMLAPFSRLIHVAREVEVGDVYVTLTHDLTQLRALICWYAVAAGNLHTIVGYYSLLKDFKSACESIKNESGIPPNMKADGTCQLVPPGSVYGSRKGSARPTEKELDSAPEGRKSAKKRKTTDTRDSSSEGNTPKQKESDFSTQFLQAQAVMRGEYTKMKNHATLKEAENANMRGRFDSLRQDYQNKTNECDELKQQVNEWQDTSENLRKEVENMRKEVLEERQKVQEEKNKKVEQWERAEAEKKNAERAEKRLLEWNSRLTKVEGGQGD